MVFILTLYFPGGAFITLVFMTSNGIVIKVATAPCQTKIQDTQALHTNFNYTETFKSNLPSTVHSACVCNTAEKYNERVYLRSGQVIKHQRK